MKIKGYVEIRTKSVAFDLKNVCAYRQRLYDHLVTARLRFDDESTRAGQFAANDCIPCVLLLALTEAIAESIRRDHKEDFELLVTVLVDPEVCGFLLKAV